MHDVDECKNCVIQAKEIARLNALVAKLETENMKMRAMIQAVKDRCHPLASANADILNAGEVPRGRWAYLRGQLETANDVLSDLGEKPTAKIKKKGLFGGLSFRIFTR